MSKFIINLGLFASIIYFGLLYEKIAKPTFKNLDIDSFLILGPLAVVFVVLDYLIIKRFVREFKNEVTAVKKELGVK